MDPRHHPGKPASSQRQGFPLLEHINQHRPLIVLAKLVAWNAIDQATYETMGPTVRKRLDKLLGRTRCILRQRPKNKADALHAPEVECISKGKVRVRYEFGVKVSIVTTLKEGLVSEARSMPGNPYDGHTLHGALEQRSHPIGGRTGNGVR